MSTCHLILFLKKSHQVCLHRAFHFFTFSIVPSTFAHLCPSRLSIVMALPKSTLSRCSSAPPRMSSTSISQASASKTFAQASIRVTGPDSPSSEGLQEVDETIRTIKAHLSSRHRESGIELRVDLKSRHFNQITQFLDRTGVKYDVDGEHTLFIHGMITAIHQSLELLAMSIFARLKYEILLPEEARYLNAGAISYHLNGKIKGKGSKRQTSRKIPDQGFIFNDPQTKRRHRTVIFEAAFTETYDDLIRDMEQWLLHSRGEVQLVVLANIKEDKKQLLKQQKTDSFKDHAAKILEHFGNELGRSKHAEILMADACVYQGHQATNISGTLAERLNHEVDDIIDMVQVENWIGPITADFEFWVLRDSKPHRRGRARVFPGLIGYLPPIYAGDVIPLSCQGSFPNFDASRKLYLDLEEFRCQLLGGIREDAVERAYEYACPNSEDDEDDDYQE
ncbi:hypothetical protein BDW42DRAFT_169986 [Aspergillus taichungensis]|uniref:Uncharacterized protein n=1 Tax=Aspergillus taichungensis TaxID=482145 RepID=A0A2J5HU31_9EURO|nr:hypothetical protein BDW42DRAFT_169986 [Aspergillus taichungensis]